MPRRRRRRPRRRRPPARRPRARRQAAGRAAAAGRDARSTRTYQASPAVSRQRSWCSWQCSASAGRPASMALIDASTLPPTIIFVKNADPQSLTGRCRGCFFMTNFSPEGSAGCPFPAVTSPARPCWPRWARPAR
ncbi:hypothetical protein E1262_09705 [Jiangella aurantiaca]|uniref:Uncharacterized protein n=1 Tax=Jiangella aurantiaca TaxID=2530373 RepID=A0A4R5ADI4_9ACTN|nr:hypothetical protein E1262_09705 [Jiangella aurantiaca]